MIYDNHEIERRCHHIDEPQLPCTHTHANTPANATPATLSNFRQKDSLNCGAWLEVFRSSSCSKRTSSCSSKHSNFSPKRVSSLCSFPLIWSKRWKSSTLSTNSRLSRLYSLHCLVKAPFGSPGRWSPAKELFRLFGTEPSSSD